MIVKRIKRNLKCFFCEQDLEPDFHDRVTLSRFLSERGKILSADKTGNCMSHQRKLAKAIKRARFLAILPFVVKIK